MTPEVKRKLLAIKMPKRLCFQSGRSVPVIFPCLSRINPSRQLEALFITLLHRVQLSLVFLRTRHTGHLSPSQFQPANQGSEELTRTSSLRHHRDFTRRTKHRRYQPTLFLPAVLRNASTRSSLKNFLIQPTYSII